METTNYKYYEVELDFTDEAQIIMASSEEEAREEIASRYAEVAIQSVKEVDSTSFAVGDTEVAKKQNTANHSILAGKNPFQEEAEDLEELDLTRVKKAVEKGGTNKAMKMKASELRKEIDAAKARQKEGGKLATEELTDFEKQMQEKRGLWDNIHAKRKRIKNGSGERMRKPGSDGAPSAKDLKDSQKEDVNESVEFITEATDKLMYLARIGLVNRNEVVLLRKALKIKKENEPMSRRYRDILLKVMDKLIAMIMNNDQMFNRARKSVQEEAEIVEMFDNILTEAGYCDPPKNMKEFRKRYPDLAKKIKSTDSGDFNTAQQTVSESYSNHLSLITKK